MSVEPQLPPGDNAGMPAPRSAILWPAVVSGSLVPFLAVVTVWVFARDKHAGVFCAVLTIGAIIAAVFRYGWAIPCVIIGIIFASLLDRDPLRAMLFASLIGLVVGLCLDMGNYLPDERHPPEV